LLVQRWCESVIIVCFSKAVYGIREVWAGRKVVWGSPTQRICGLKEKEAVCAVHFDQSILKRAFRRSELSNLLDLCCLVMVSGENES
jgi:hypothetical protein